MIIEDGFTKITLSAKNLDTFIIRTAIFHALKEAIPQFKGRLLDIGCGKMPYREYLLENSAITEYTGLDIENALVYDAEISPDFTWDGITMPFPDECFDCAIGTEVLEHCPDPEITLKEILRVLKPWGVFFFTVPFLWNLHEVPHDEYRYTPFSLERHMRNSGFKNIEIEATGGWHASLAQMIGLWVRRSNISSRKRKFLSIIFKPFIRFLIKKDTKSSPFDEGPMITGLYGIARKGK